MSKTQVSITTEYINLGQFLKLTDFISNGGEARFFLEDNNVLVNGEIEERRGKKLYPGDEIEINGALFTVTAE